MRVKFVAMRNVLVLLILAVFFCVFAACSGAGGTQSPVETPKTERDKLETPIVRIEEDGTVTWQRVENANRYEVYIDGTLVLTTAGYSYEISESEVGTYTVTVVAVDSLDRYDKSDPSETQVYEVKAGKLETPILRFDGESIVWKTIEHAAKYKIYLDNVVTEGIDIEEAEGNQFLKFPNLPCGSYVVEVKAISGDENYIDSEISEPVTYYIADSSAEWNVEKIWTNWERSSDIPIIHANNEEILVWVDIRGAQDAALENFVEIPAGSKAFTITGFKPSSYGAMDITLSIKKAGGEYQDIVVESSDYITAEDTGVQTYYWGLPEEFTDGNAFIKATMESSGAYQAQFVIRSFAFSADTEYIPPVIPVNQAISLVSVSKQLPIKYNTEKGYLTMADVSDSAGDCAVMFVPADDVGEEYYRIKTQDGLYLTIVTILREDNVAWDYIFAVPYNAAIEKQVWFTRPVVGAEHKETFTILNYGARYDDNGTSKNLVLNAPYPGFDGCCTWQDIVSTDLQFEVYETSASFADEGTFTQSTELNLEESFVAYFVGRRTALSFDENKALVLGELIGDATDLSGYAWKLESAGEGYYYIKTGNGMYLCADKDTSYFVTEASKAEDDSKFLWSISSRGGDMFYLGNKYVNEDSMFIQYMVYDILTNRIGFYTDLCTSGDQILRFVNSNNI